MAHDFVPGATLSATGHVDDLFFERLWHLLGEVHAARIAYVDLHKAENILVGTDGQPYLMDFQISLYVPRFLPFGWVLALFQKSDHYHFAKHKKLRRPDQCDDETERLASRPWWISLHRLVARPLRELRRALLVKIGVRAKGGKVWTEQVPEEGLRKAG